MHTPEGAEEEPCLFKSAVENAERSLDAIGFPGVKFMYLLATHSVIEDINIDDDNEFIKRTDPLKKEEDQDMKEEMAESEESCAVDARTDSSKKEEDRDTRKNRAMSHVDVCQLEFKAWLWKRDLGRRRAYQDFLSRKKAQNSVDGQQYMNSAEVWQSSKEVLQETERRDFSCCFQSNKQEEPLEEKQLSSAMRTTKRSVIEYYSKVLNAKMKRKEQISCSKRNYKALAEGPDPPPGLPKLLSRILTGAKATKPILVIQKALTETDVDSDENFLSLPIRHLGSVFLTCNENECVARKDGLPVFTLMPPALKVAEITLKKRVTEEASRTTSLTFVFTKNWNTLRSQSNLEKGDVVQVWTFRYQGALCFALVKVQGHIHSSNAGPKWWK